MLTDSKDPDRLGSLGYLPCLTPLIPQHITGKEHGYSRLSVRRGRFVSTCFCLTGQTTVSSGGLAFGIAGKLRTGLGRLVAFQFQSFATVSVSCSETELEELKGTNLHQAARYLPSSHTHLHCVPVFAQSFE